jgi:hypothetical protein
MYVLTREKLLLNISIFLLVDRLRHASIHRIYTDNGRLCVEDTHSNEKIYIKKARQ